MSQGALCPNLSQKVQKEMSQMANRNLLCVMRDVNLNHLIIQHNIEKYAEQFRAKFIRKNVKCQKIALWQAEVVQ